MRVALIFDHETSVAVTGTDGRGGRNSEYLPALALALAPDGAAGVHALAVDTDGIDGSEDTAGARPYPDSLARAGARASIRRHCSRSTVPGMFLPGSGISWSAARRGRT